MKTSFTSLLVSFAVILVLVSPQGLNASSCLQEWVGDGYCDPECNILEFSLDGGDCCEEDCLNGEDLDYECGTNGYDCKKPIENTNKYQLTREYSGFTLTLQCDKEAQAGYAIKYAYNLTHDRDDLGSKRTYGKDSTVPIECQQSFSPSKLPSYKHVECTRSGRKKNPFCFDRGHIVMGNHMDGTSLTRNDASYATNLVPQSTGLNQSGGSWKETEDLIECHRDHSDVARLEIFGGLIYDDDTNDYFIESHGIPTPDTYYKVVVKYFKDSSVLPDVIAWVMENKPTDTADRLDMRYNDGGDLIAVKQLKRLVSDQLALLPPTFSETAFESGSSWDRDGTCYRGNLFKDEL